MSASQYDPGSTTRGERRYVNLCRQYIKDNPSTKTLKNVKIKVKRLRSRLRARHRLALLLLLRDSEWGEAGGGGRHGAVRCGVVRSVGAVCCAVRGAGRGRAWCFSAPLRAASIEAFSIVCCCIGFSMV